MSKIIELIEVQRDKLNNKYLTPRDHLHEVGILEGMKLMASTIKAEIMGLDTIISWSEVDYVKQSDVDNLFKESEL